MFGLPASLAKKVRSIIVPRRLIRQQAVTARAFEPFTQRFPATIVAVNGSVYQHNNPNYVHIKPYNDDSTNPPVVWNDRVNPVDGLHVWVGPNPGEPNQLAVLGLYTHGLPPSETPNAIYFNVPPHGFTHEIQYDTSPGIDPVRVFQDAIWLFKTVAGGGLNVSTYAFGYSVDGVRRFFPGVTTDMSSFLPGAGFAQRHILYLDPTTGFLNVQSGSVVVDHVAIPVPYPEIPRGMIGTAWIKTVGGQTSIVAADINDARPFLTPGVSTKPYEATRQGEVLYSLDAATFTAALPVVDPDTMTLVIDPDTFTIVVT